jgi:hypothetical protein
VKKSTLFLVLVIIIIGVLLVSGKFKFSIIQEYADTLGKLQWNCTLDGNKVTCKQTITGRTPTFLCGGNWAQDNGYCRILSLANTFEDTVSKLNLNPANYDKEYFYKTLTLYGNCKFAYVNGLYNGCTDTSWYADGQTLSSLAPQCSYIDYTNLLCVDAKQIYNPVCNAKYTNTERIDVAYNFDCWFTAELKELPTTTSTLPTIPPSGEQPTTTTIIIPAPPQPKPIWEQLFNSILEWLNNLFMWFKR